MFAERGGTRLCFAGDAAGRGISSLESNHWQLEFHWRVCTCRSLFQGLESLSQCLENRRGRQKLEGFIPRLAGKLPADGRNSVNNSLPLWLCSEMEKIFLEKRGALLGQVLQNWGHFQWERMSCL